MTPDRDSLPTKAQPCFWEAQIWGERGGGRSKELLQVLRALPGPAYSLPGDKEPQNPDKTKFLKLKKKERKKACRLPLPGSGLGWAGVVWGQGLSEASASFSLS